MAGQRLMILDEPVTGLDPHASQNMYDIINGLNKDGMTVVMISHDVDEALDPFDDELSQLRLFERRTLPGIPL